MNFPTVGEERRAPQVDEGNLSSNLVELESVAQAVSSSLQQIPDSPEEDAHPTLHSNMKLRPWDSQVWSGHTIVPQWVQGWACPQTSSANIKATRQELLTTADSIKHPGWTGRVWFPSHPHVTEKLVC